MRSRRSDHVVLARIYFSLREFDKVGDLRTVSQCASMGSARRMLAWCCRISPIGCPTYQHVHRHRYSPPMAYTAPQTNGMITTRTTIEPINSTDSFTASPFVPRHPTTSRSWRGQRPPSGSTPGTLAQSRRPGVPCGARASTRGGRR